MKAKFSLGIDIGGTKIRVGLVSSGNKIVSSLRVPTESAKGKSAVLKNVINSIQAIWKPGTGSIGVGIAGLVDHQKGVFKGGPNLPKSLNGANIAAILQKRFKVPVKVDNDVHCFTLAESRIGSGRGFKTVVGVAFGTGIGGAICHNGNLERGRNNAAGEFGHMTVSLSSEDVCSCGRTGHFEAYASGKAMSRIYGRLTGRSMEPLEVEQAVMKGDRSAIATLDLMRAGMVAGLSSIIHAVNPDVIVVGGGLSAVKPLWAPVRKQLRSGSVFTDVASTPIVRSKLGTDANIIGAAMLHRPKA